MAVQLSSISCHNNYLGIQYLKCLADQNKEIMKGRSSSTNNAIMTLIVASHPHYNAKRRTYPWSASFLLQDCATLYYYRSDFTQSRLLTDYQIILKLYQKRFKSLSILI